MDLKGYFIQYKFIIPEHLKHSSYTYQKLFRALYGYTQNVTKATGKVYKYHRQGILSRAPYMRPGKNCVIIPSSAFQPLINFFKTGKNPTHAWHIKGDWKAVYYMDEKKLAKKDVVSAFEKLLDRTFLVNKNDEHRALEEELKLAAEGSKETSDAGYLAAIKKEAKTFIEHPWFNTCYPDSERLKSIYRNYQAIKQ